MYNYLLVINKIGETFFLKKMNCVKHVKIQYFLKGKNMLYYSKPFEIFEI